MGDGLIYSTPGSTEVGTGELFASAYKWSLVSGFTSFACLSITSAIVLGRATYLQGPPDFAAEKAQQLLLEASGRLRAIADRAAHLSSQLHRSAEQYGAAERFSEAILRAVGGVFMNQLGHVIGPALPLWLLLAPPGVENDDPQEASELDGLSEPGPMDAVNAFLSDPTVVNVIQSLIGGGDDLLGGALGLPPALSFLFGDQVLGLTGPATTATAALVGAQKFGAGFEGPVAVQKVETKVVAPASGFEEHLGRIPGAVSDAPQGGQIVIERIETPGAADKYNVYISGTQTFDPVSRDNPFDFTANMTSEAGLSSGAYRAVLEAMQREGITSSSQVNLWGYSQGALIASQIAHEQLFNVQTVGTIGGPNGSTIIPAGINAVIVEHTEDLVPTLGGPQGNDDALIVRRAAFAENGVPTGLTVPAHHFPYYRETLKMLDTDVDVPQAARAARVVNDFYEGATSVTSTTYLATRTDAG